MKLLVLLFLSFSYANAEQLSTRSTSTVVLAHFNEGTGTTTLNSKDNTAGVLVTGVSWVTGKISNGISVNGVNGSYMYFPVTPPTVGLTVMAWIKPNTVAAGNYSVVHHPYDQTGWVTPYVLYDMRYTGTGVYYQVTTADIVAYSDTVAYSFVVDTWYHLALTWVQGGYGHLYINGVEVDTIGPFAEAQPIVNPISTSLRVGGLNNVNCCSFSGTIDEVETRYEYTTSGFIKKAYLQGLGRHNNVQN